MFFEKLTRACFIQIAQLYENFFKSFFNAGVSPSVAQSSEQAPVTSEIVALPSLAMDACEKSQSTPLNYK